MRRRGTAHATLWLMPGVRRSLHVVLGVGLAALAGGCAADDASIDPEAAEVASVVDVPSPPRARTVVSRAPVRLEGELDTWMADVARRGARQTTIECAEAAELEGAHLCASSSLSTMNRAFLRASIYAEGNYGARRGEVVSVDDVAYRMGMPRAEGHDIRAEHLRAFWSAARRACNERGPRFCPTRAEKELFEGYVLERLDEQRPFVLLAFAADGARALVAHEVLHAQYFLSPTFAAATNRFWAEAVSEDDRLRALERLAPVYDVGDALLVRNEFMAYVLMPDAEFQMLAPLAPTYRGGLRNALVESGSPPLDVR